MINLNIGKAVVARIRATNIGLTRFCPCIADAETKFPYAVYLRESVDADDSKDIRTNIQKAVVQVNIFSDDYDESLQLTQKIVQLFDGYRGQLGGCNIQSTKVTDSGEGWANDAYCQTLSIEFRYL